jgi:signal transduction histidine kinase
MVVQMVDRARILIIDDEEVVLDSCTMILQGGNYEVATAQNGTLGLNLINDFKPDLIFIDLKMPGITGMEVIERTGQLDPTIVMVVITGFATVNSAVEAMKIGAYDFLPKPFTPDEFRLITKRGLERRKLTLETIDLRKEKEMLRENFAAIVSHELKSPLSAIQQNIYVFETELATVLNDAQKARLVRMKSRIDDLLKLIHSWLRVLSVDISKIKESFTSISIPVILAKAIESVEPHAVRKNIEIITSIDDPLYPVEGEEVSFQEALTNIIGNAVKYSYADSKVFVSVKNNKDQVEIAITDAGVGIAEDELPRIFGDFYRGTSGQASTDSHGLGLTLSRRIIEAHGGQMSMSSELGKGTTFTITLPALQTK